MRDTNENMIELLDVSRENDIYSSLIKHQINGEFYNLRFGILTSDFVRLKRIIEFRPFENTGVAPYRYFFALNYSNHPLDKSLAVISVRVEQHDRHKQFDFDISKEFISNLLWFNSLKDKKDIENLIDH